MMLWMHNQGVRSTATIASLTVSRGKFRTCDPSLVRCSCALDATMWSLKTTKHKISILNWVKLSFTNTVLIGIMCPFTKASYAPEGSRQWFIWWLADEGCGVSWFHCDCFTRLDWLSHDWLTRQLNFCVCVWIELRVFDYIVKIPVYPKDCCQWGHHLWSDAWKWEGPWPGQMIICFYHHDVASTIECH